MAFTGAATVVVAQSFQLIDPNGVIIATLGSNLAAGTQTLSFLHTDSLVSDSSIFWTRPNAFGAGTEALILTGPKGLADSGANAPTVQLDRLASGVRSAVIQGVNHVDINTIDAAGTLTANVVVDGTTSVLTVRANSIPLTDTSAGHATRGSIFGIITYHADLSAGAIVTVASPQNILTINVAAQPVAGGMVVISAHARSSTVATWTLFINNVAQPLTFLSPAGVAGTFGQTWSVSGMAILAVYQIILQVATAIGGTMATDTSLTVTQYL